MPKELFAKRRMKWFNLKLDEYTYSLVERAVSEGRAGSMVEAVGMSISTLLGIRYKPLQEFKMEQELARVRELSEKAMGGEQ